MFSFSCLLSPGSEVNVRMNPTLSQIFLLVRAWLFYLLLCGYLQALGSWNTSLDFLRKDRDLGPGDKHIQSAAPGLCLTESVPFFFQQSVFLRLYYPSEDQEPLDTVWIPNKEYFFGLSKFLGTPHFIGNFLNFLYGKISIGPVLKLYA